MREVQVHPLAELFPLMDDVSFKALVADIKANGQRDPISLWDGQILDGRNRYLACVEIGTAPLIKNLEGPIDPLAFVVSKNLIRRHLGDSQRAEIAARITNIQRGGDRGNQHTGGKPPIGGLPNDDGDGAEVIGIKRAADLMNVSVRSVERARVIQRRGVPELQAAVAGGGVSLMAAETVSYLPQDDQREIATQGPAAIQKAAKAVRAGRPAVLNNNVVPMVATVLAPAVEPNGTRGSTISVPNGSTVETQVRKGIALEADGMPPDKAAKEVGIREQTYRRIRDLITLLEDMELIPADRRLIASALGAVNETRQLGDQAAVDPIIRRVFGSNLRNHHSVKAARKRVEHFATVCGLAVQSCLNFDLEEFEIPYLSEEETRRWVKDLGVARRSLDAFLKKLQGV